MAEIITTEHYKGKVIIDFYPSSHRARIRGRKDYLISNTACTGILDKSRPFLKRSKEISQEYFRDYIAKSKRDEFRGDEMIAVMEHSLNQWDEYCEKGREIGKKLHEWAEQFAKAKMNKEPIPKIDESMGTELVQSISGFLSWYNSNDIKFLEVEKFVYSKKYDYCGITDGVVMLNGRKTLLDYKTAKDIYPEYEFQVAGYQIAYEEEFGKSLQDFLILKFCKQTGDFALHPIDKSKVEENKKAFLSALALKKILKARSKWEK